MLTLMEIPDVEKFLDLAANSGGDVLLHLPDGSLCDLKRNCVARQLLRVLGSGRGGLRLTLSSRDDIPAFLDYMLQAGL